MHTTPNNISPALQQLFNKVASLNLKTQFTPEQILENYSYFVLGYIKHLKFEGIKINLDNTPNITRADITQALKGINRLIQQMGGRSVLQSTANNSFIQDLADFNWITKTNTIEVVADDLYNYLQEIKKDHQKNAKYIETINLWVDEGINTFDEDLKHLYKSYDERRLSLEDRMKPPHLDNIIRRMNEDWKSLRDNQGLELEGTFKECFHNFCMNPELVKFKISCALAQPVLNSSQPVLTRTYSSTDTQNVSMKTINLDMAINSLATLKSFEIEPRCQAITTNNTLATSKKLKTFEKSPVQWLKDYAYYFFAWHKHVGKEVNIASISQSYICDTFKKINEFRETSGFYINNDGIEVSNLAGLQDEFLTEVAGFDYKRSFNKTFEEMANQLNIYLQQIKVLPEENEKYFILLGKIVNADENVRKELLKSMPANSGVNLNFSEYDLTDSQVLMHLLSILKKRNADCLLSNRNPLEFENFTVPDMEKGIYEDLIKEGGLIEFRANCFSPYQHMQQFLI